MQSMVSSQRFSRGFFTFKELLIVVVLLGILSGLARPSIKGVYRRYLYSNTQNAIKHLVQTAKGRAMTNPSVHCGVHFSTAGDSVQLFSDTDQPLLNTYSSLDKKYLQPYALPKGILITITSTAKDIIFRGDGSASAAFRAIIQDTLSTYSSTLSVLPSTGRIKIIK